MERSQKKQRTVRNSFETPAENVSSEPSHERVDRLSSLPDSVLCRILGFLPTETSVATSVLAKRWRFIWTRVPFVDFDFSRIRKKLDPMTDRYSEYDECDLNCQRRLSSRFGGRIDWDATKRSRIGFSDIVHRVLLKISGVLGTFRLLYFPYDFTDYHIDTFISNVIRRGVESIDIYCQGGGGGDGYVNEGNKVPLCLFRFSSLVELRLTDCSIRIKVKNSVSLLSLKKFHLANIHFGNDETFRRLLSGCPILEELSVIGIDNKPVSKWQLSSDTLKQLVVEIKKAPQGGSRRRAALDFDWQIHAPSLRFLKLRSVFPGIILAPSLIEVHIQVNSSELNFGFKEHELLNFLNVISNIQSMTLISEIQFGDSSLEALTMQFHNLESLCFDGYSRFLFKLLEHAENLKHLTCLQDHSVYFHESKKISQWQDPVHIPKCLLFQVKNIECLYAGTRFVIFDFEMIQYLLKNGLVLNNMIIRTDPNYPEKMRALKMISPFKRGSPNCQLFFH